MSELHPLLASQREKAKLLQKRICLPEAEKDERTAYAVRYLYENQLARPVLVGNRDRLMAKGIDMNMCEIYDPEETDIDEYMKYYQEKRAKEGKSDEEVKSLIMENEIIFGMLLLAVGRCDGLVAGAMNSTAAVLSPAFKLIGKKEELSSASSCFLMLGDNKDIGENGVFVFGDCAVNLNPDAEMLAEIGAVTSESFQKIVGADPKTAFLSYSTKGSAGGEDAEKVKKACALATKNRPDIVFEGELQLDAAINPVVSEAKAPKSKIKGKANTLIFPDLESGNIGYKMAQYFGGMTAVGPILQGIKKPVNDLSRGCNGQDIVQMVCLTAIQAD